jgi:hypothetical protein
LIRKNTCMSLWSFQGARGARPPNRENRTPARTGTGAVSQNSTA